MDAFELSFRPADDKERREFEGVLHDFVEIESRKPRSESSSVFASYDAPAGRWVIAFETHVALRSFRDLWRAHVARHDHAPLAPPAWRSAQA